MHPPLRGRLCVEVDKLRPDAAHAAQDRGGGAQQQERAQAQDARPAVREGDFGRG
jgi:hypothetical protein